MDVAPRDYTASLTRGLTLLESFTEMPDQTVTEIAARAGLSKSSAARLAAALAKSGYLSRDVNTKRYRLGFRLWELGALAIQRLGLAETGRQAMRALSASTGETIHLAVLDGLDVVYIDKIDGSNPVVAYTRIGGRNPAHAVASGKAMLSELADKELKEILPDPLVGFTESTIVSRDLLISHLHEVRANGYAVNLGELRGDVGGVASVVCDASNRPVAALGVTCPVARLTRDLIQTYGRAVRDAALGITA